MAIGKTWEEGAVKWLVDKIKAASALATKSSAGLMSAADKAKLDGIGDIGNISVGGRNLLRNSHASEVQYAYPATGYTDAYHVRTPIPMYGTIYTLSFWAKSTVDGDRIRTFVYYPSNIISTVGSQGQIGDSVDGRCEFRLSTAWEHYWVTVTTPKGVDARSVIMPRLIAGDGTGTLSFMMEQLEEGNKATAWRPAIEDTAPLVFRNPIAYASAWASGAPTYDNRHLYHADIPLTGVTSNMYADVIFYDNLLVTYDLAQMCDTYDGGVRIYSETAIPYDFNVATIMCWPI